MGPPNLNEDPKFIGSQNGYFLLGDFFMQTRTVTLHSRGIESCPYTSSPGNPKTLGETWTSPNKSLETKTNSTFTKDVFGSLEWPRTKTKPSEFYWGPLHRALPWQVTSTVGGAS